MGNVIYAIDRVVGETVGHLTHRANEWLQLQDITNGYSYEYVKEKGIIVAIMIAYSN